MKDFIKKITGNKKRLYLIIAGTISFIVIIVLIIILGFRTNEKKLNGLLEQMGIDFYENHYYNQSDKTETGRIDFVQKFKDKGIKINLDGLRQYPGNEEIVEKFVNSKTKEKCNTENTRVIVYPEAPFGEKDYRIVVELDCGFDKE